MANPTLFLSTFDDSIAFTDASGSGAWTPIDPTRYDVIGSQNGLWLEEATTNHCVDPQVNSGADYLALRCTLEVDTETVPPVDGNVFKATRTTTPGSAGWAVEGGVGAAISAGAAQVWTVTVYAKSDDGITVTLGVDWKNGVDGAGSITGSSTGTPVLLTSEWQRIDATFTTPASTQSGQPFLYDKNASSNGTIVYSTNFQFEQKGYATSYADGAQGDGYAFTGTSHDSTSTRAASSVSVDQGGTTRIDPAAGSIAFRYTRKIDTAAEEVILTSGVVGAGTDYLELGIDSTDHFYAEWNSNNAGATRVASTGTLSADTEYFLYTDWDGTAIRVSIDNGSLDSDTRAAAENDWSTGDLTLSAATGSYVVGPFLVGNRVLTSKEIARLYGKETWSFTTLRPINQRMTNFQLRPKAA